MKRIYCNLRRQAEEPNLFVYQYMRGSEKMTYKGCIDSARVKIRERMNLYLGKCRRKKLLDEDVTIISNNCWAGHVYRYFGIEYLSPTIGVYFFADDYVKFCKNLKYYIEQKMKFI